ncbi:DedA family protein [Fictibacillus iocasae]|uniref:DedA family protein n=1 Tax=Fictibacillus iocasae TaxID=2715437 RepID=A0ABW2NP16_9BACL
MDFEIMQLIHQYGYISLSILLALGIVGLPVPDEILLATAGCLTAADNLSLPLVLLFAVAGSFLGITASYYIGIKFGRPLLDKFAPKIGISVSHIDKTNQYFQRYGKAALFFGYFIPGVRHLTAYFAGMYSTPFKTFALYAYSGAVFWCFFFILLGHMLAQKIYLAFDIIHRLGLYAFSAVLIGAVIWLIVWNKKKESISEKF